MKRKSSLPARPVGNRTPWLGTAVLSLVPLLLGAACDAELSIVHPTDRAVFQAEELDLQVAYSACDYTTLRVCLNGEDISTRLTAGGLSAVGEALPMEVGPNVLTASIQTWNPFVSLEDSVTVYRTVAPEPVADAPSPGQIAFDAGGNLFIGRDEEGPVPILRLPAGGTEAEPFGPRLIRPSVLCMDDEGHPVVASLGPDEPMVRILPAGDVEPLAELTGVFEAFASLVYLPGTTTFTYTMGDLFYFAARTVDSQEGLFVLDPREGLCWKMETDLPAPLKGLTRNRDDRLFASTGQGVHIIAQAGEVQTFLETDSFGPGPILLNRDGLLFAVDETGRNVVGVTASGDAFPVAVDFGDIRGVAFAPDGSLYIADRMQDRVFRIPFDFQGVLSGRTTLSPIGSIPAGSLGTWTVTYTVGPMGFAPGGRLLIGFRHPMDWGSYQPFQPREPGYLTSRCSAPGSTTEARAKFLMADKYVQVTLQGEPLRRGDRIEVVLGDTTQGSPGQEAPTVAVEDTELFVFDDIYAADVFDSLFTVPEGRTHRYDVICGQAESLLVCMKSYGRPDEPVTISLRAVDAYGNTATTYTGVVALHDFATMELLGGITFEPEDRGLKVVDWLAFPNEGIRRVLFRDLAQDLETVSNPIRIESDPEAWVFWGDLHGHSLLSDGLLSADAFYEHARTVNQVDFASLTDHGGSSWEHRSLVGNVLNRTSFEEVKAAALRNHLPGAFVTLVGLENSGPFGHRNVYFSTPDPPYIEYREKPDKFFAAVREAAEPGQVMVLAHQHNGVPGESGIDWDSFAPDLERIVELCSNKGVREYAGNPYFACDTAAELYGDRQVVTQDGLAMGYRFGFVGASDNHTGWPGGGGAAGTRTCPIFGLTAVRAAELTREAVWEALYNRRTVTTTGARILLDLRLNGEPIGSELPAVGQRFLEIEFHATVPILSLEIIKNNEIVYTLGEPLLGGDFTWFDTPSLEADFYYVRLIQQDGHVAWTSPIWVGP